MITVDDVRRLLDSDDSHAVLVVIEGRVDVVGEADLGTEAYRGALQVIARDELSARLGDDYSFTLTGKDSNEDIVLGMSACATQYDANGRPVSGAYGSVEAGRTG